MSNLLKKYGERLAARDGGWYCHYCGAPLCPPDEIAQQNALMDKLYPSGGMVHEAGAPIEPWPFKAYPQVDHKIPRSKGGGTILENLVLACIECNIQKGAMPYERFVEQKKR